jgi:hypothetical protein
MLAAGADPSAADRRRVAAAVAQRLIDAAGVEPTRRALPPEVLGTTFVYDPEVRRYVPAPERAGAPPNGVRFILYAVNPYTHEPVVTAEVGHADLIDEGVEGASGVALHLIAVTGDLTFLDYSVTADGADGAGSLTVAGFATDGTTRLLFRIQATGRQSPEGAVMDLAFQLAVPERSFAVTARVRGVRTQTGAASEVELTIQSAGTTIGLMVHGDDHAIDAVVTVNGQPFAVIRGDPAHPEIRGADGRELSPEEMAVLQHIMQLTGHTFELLGHLLRPAEQILGGGWIG